MGSKHVWLVIEEQVFPVEGVGYGEYKSETVVACYVRGDAAKTNAEERTALVSDSTITYTAVRMPLITEGEPPQPQWSWLYGRMMRAKKQVKQRTSP